MKTTWKTIKPENLPHACLGFSSTSPHPCLVRTTFVAQLYETPILRVRTGGVIVSYLCPLLYLRPYGLVQCQVKVFTWTPAEDGRPELYIMEDSKRLRLRAVSMGSSSMLCDWTRQPQCYTRDELQSVCDAQAPGTSGRQIPVI